jgi:hypothetical protein
MGVCMRLLINLAVLTCLWSVGCNNAGPPAPAPGKAMAPPVVAEPTDVAPTFAPVKVSINDKGASCITTFTPLPIVAGRDVKYGSECGHPGTVTKLSWRYLGTTDKGDRYEFERTFPVDGASHTTTRKEVVYAGKELLLFDDEASTVHMRPAASDEQSADAAATIP